MEYAHCTLDTQDYKYRVKHMYVIFLHLHGNISDEGSSILRHKYFAFLVQSDGRIFHIQDVARIAIDKTPIDSPLYRQSLKPVRSQVLIEYAY
jgi:hypothetical protein